MASVTFDELVRAGREMRRWQKTFFRSAKGAEKDLALEEARKWEHIFDTLIERPQETQLDIFSVLNAEDEPPHPVDLMEAEDPFPPLPPEPKTPLDAAFSAAMREVVRDGK